MEAVILIGLQGAGKSTFYERALAATHLRISMDLAGTRARERRLMEACLAAGQAFAVDNTNSTREQRRVYIAAARAAGFRVKGYVFPPEITESLARNARRSGRAKVPVPGIYRTLKYWEEPGYEEGFDELFRVTGEGFDLEPIPRSGGDGVTGALSKES